MRMFVAGEWTDGARQEVIGRDAILEVISDERKLARITAKSSEPIRKVMRAVKLALDQWLKAAAIQEGAIFRRVSRTGKYLVLEFGAVGRILVHLSQAGRVDVEQPPKRTRGKGTVVRLVFSADVAILVREFGQGDREQIEASHRDPAVPQVLTLLNGFIERKITSKQYTPSYPPGTWRSTS